MHKIDSKNFTITGHDNHKLSAKFDVPEGEPVGYALFAHCFTCTKDVLAASRIARELKECGIATLRFDFTGLGDSCGDFSDTNFSTNVLDIIAAADFMNEKNAPVSILIGHSLGGSAVLAAAKSIPSAKAVVSIGSPCEVSHVLEHLGDDREKILKDGQANVCLTGRPFVIKKQFVEDAQKTDIKNCVKNLGKALLVMHAPLDDIVGIENAAKIFQWAHHPKSYISLDNADHLITKKDDAAYAARIISVWARRYI